MLYTETPQSHKPEVAFPIWQSENPYKTDRKLVYNSFTEQFSIQTLYIADADMSKVF